MIHVGPDTPIGRIHVRVRAESQVETFDALKQIWKEVAPDVLHQFAELDRSAQAPFSIGVMVVTVGKTVSLFPMTISCLGLLGLAIQALKRRTKEVGVRKVLGASILSIFGLLSARFVRLTVLGCILGCVLSHFAMTRVVSGFAYQVPMTLDLFAIPAVGAVLVALGSIGYHTLRTARTDPMNELRYE